MEDSLKKRQLLMLLMLTAASILIFQMSVVFFLFVVPLYIAGSRYGSHALYASAAVVALTVILQTLISGSVVEDSHVRTFLLITELLFPLAMAAGMLWSEYSRSRRIFSFLAATAGFAAVSMPVIIYYSGQEEIVSLLKEQILFVTGAFRDRLTSAGGVYDNTVILNELKPDKIVEATANLVFRHYLFVYFVMMSAGWFIADAVRRRFERGSAYRIQRFRAPEILLWPLIISMSGILADILLGIGWIGYLLWNGAFVLAFIYGLHGIGLVSFLMDKNNFSRNGRRLLALTVVFTIMVPGLNFIVLIGFPALGLSEHWIRYRD